MRCSSTKMIRELLREDSGHGSMAGGHALGEAGRTRLGAWGSRQDEACTAGGSSLFAQRQLNPAAY